MTDQSWTIDKEAVENFGYEENEELRALLEKCVDEAREMGWKGDFDDYTFTQADLDWVTDQLGYKPTEDEWKASGLRHVGGSHVADS